MSKAESMTTADQLRQQIDTVMKNESGDTDMMSKLNEEVEKNKKLSLLMQLKDAEINRLRKRKPLSVETKTLMDTLQKLKASGKMNDDTVPLGDLMKTIERMDHEILELREKCKVFEVVDQKYMDWTHFPGSNQPPDATVASARPVSSRAQQPVNEEPVRVHTSWCICISFPFTVLAIVTSSGVHARC